MYYLIEKTTTQTGSPAKAISEKPNIDNAMMTLHQVMASAMANSAVTSALVMIIDERGAIQASDYWERSNVSE